MLVCEGSLYPTEVVRCKRARPRRGGTLQSGSHNRESRRTIVRATKLNNQERPKVGRLPRQPCRITLIKTIVGQEVPNRNSKKPEHTIDSPILQADLRQYDYLTSSNRPTTLNMMARLNQGSGSRYTCNRLN
jgi:hypothetical protein